MAPLEKIQEFSRNPVLPDAKTQNKTILYQKIPPREVNTLLNMTENFQSKSARTLYIYFNMTTAKINT